jgi:hypothetical protein
VGGDEIIESKNFKLISAHSDIVLIRKAPYGIRAVFPARSSMGKAIRAAW